MAFINGGASKTIIEMSKTFIRRLPKFKGGVNKFLAKNAIFAIAIAILSYSLVSNLTPFTGTACLKLNYFDLEIRKSHKI